MKRLRGLLLTAFATEGPVDRRTYLVVGASLMALKYTIDAAVIFALTRVTWTPVDYLLPLASLSNRAAVVLPIALSIGLLVWTLPFIWIGVNMTVRRAADAGYPAWLAVAFFVPVLNYVLMALLSMAPTAARPETEGPALATREAAGGWFARSGMGAVVAGAGSALAIMVTAVGAFRSYGLTLFLGAPFVLGLVTGYLGSLTAPRRTRSTILLVVAAMIVAASGLLLFALEGAICLIMAFPIALPVALIGGIVGQNVARRREVWTGGMAMLLAIAPAGAAIDRGFERADDRVVLTSVEIDAPPARVWRHVVSFDEITEPPSWYFRAGLACPVRARIDGAGPGAIRYCEFTTGAFTEPIVAWDEPTRLAFAVTDQPSPLQEWSPYARVYAPHLVDYFRTTRGEFTLVALGGGRTRLEGRTWYGLRMAPGAYWNPIADAILHRIHARVLRHVKSLAEQGRPRMP